MCYYTYIFIEGMYTNMQINATGHHHEHEDSFIIERPNGSGDYLLLLVFSPSQMICNKEKITTSGNYAILYSKDTPQFYGANGSRYIDDWIHFDMTDKEVRLIEGLGISFNTPLYPDCIDELSSIALFITEEYHSNRDLREDNLSLYMRILFNRLGEAVSSHNMNPHYNSFSRIKSEIYNRPYEQYSIDILSKKANMSRSSFQHIYKELFGISTLSDIIKARIEYACYLLSSTSADISQIADMCGYKSDIHFMRQFKGQTNMTPSEYRQLNR